jgi:hypothetical protein
VSLRVRCTLLVWGLSTLPSCVAQGGDATPSTKNDQSIVDATPSTKNDQSIVDATRAHHEAPSPKLTAESDLIHLPGFEFPWRILSMENVGIEVAMQTGRLVRIDYQPLRGNQQSRQFGGDVELVVLRGNGAELTAWIDRQTGIFGNPVYRHESSATLCGQPASRIELAFDQNPDAIGYEPSRGRIMFVTVATEHAGEWLRLVYLTSENQRKKLARGEALFFESARCL